jgi:hypothetical protein
MREYTVPVSTAHQQRRQEHMPPPLLMRYFAEIDVDP